MKRSTFLAGLALAAAATARGDMVDSGFTDTSWASGLNEPVGIAWAPDGSRRLFVTEKNDAIRIVRDGVVQATPFATFPQVYSGSECGVLAVAFDPDFTTNHFVYVFVTVSDSEQRIVRFTDVNGAGTARTNIITGLPTLGANHDGGALGFGADGKLYWAIGDLGDKRGVDGNLTSLAAKVGRANRDGTVPADNPFRDGAGPNNDYIWATGFRNPFTLTFHARTGRLWLNVVGSTPDGQTSPNSGPGYEQVFVLNAGEDGGYDDYEGNQPAASRFTTPFPRPFARPAIQYKTDDFGDVDQQRTVSTLTANATTGAGTLTTTTAHPYRVGQALTVNGAGALNGHYFVGSTTATTCALTGATSSGTANAGSVAPLVQGGSITGGEFYESTAFPAAYRGSFFYGDYVAGAIMRAELRADSRPLRVTPFATNLGSITDLATGPDGALYYADIGNGEIRRIAADAPTGLIAQPTALMMRKGGKSTFTVRPAVAPVGSANVVIHTEAAGVTLSPAMLTFTAANYTTPQAITITVTEDSNGTPTEAEVELIGAGASASVHIRAGDDAAAGLTLSATALQLAEGTRGTAQVSLAAQPARNVAVVTSRAPGGKGSKIIKGAHLRFTPANWSTPQTLTFAAVQDGNTSDDSATYRIRATGFAEKRLSIATVDNDPSPPKFTSTAPAAAVASLPFRYTATATGLPAPNFFLLPGGPAGAQVDPLTGAFVWTPAAPASATFTLLAYNGRNPSAAQTFTVTAAANTAPLSQILVPGDGATVSGATAEFFGNGSDDYRCVRAEFRVDGTLAYTDTNTEGHYHHGGTHNLWDTTAIPNGPHTLTFTVFDDLGLSHATTIFGNVAN